MIIFLFSLTVFNNVESKEYQAKITRVIDGDTVDAIVNLGFNVSITERFRLADFDAPETYRPKNNNELLRGELATKILKSLILNKEVIIDTSKKGKYGRWIAVIYIKGKKGSINQYMIDNGYSK